jgi:hypothetical protein
MFEADKPRYLTCGVDAKIPLLLQVFLWQCVEGDARTQRLLTGF